MRIPSARKFPVALKVGLTLLLAFGPGLVLLALARPVAASPAHDAPPCPAGDVADAAPDWPGLLASSPSPRNCSKLHCSYKTASRLRVTCGEALTYTIWLHNRGMVTATAHVTDPVPLEMNYVAGSANEGGVYDSGTETLSWTGVAVPPLGRRSLSFVVTATTVLSPTPVLNTATITASGHAFRRHAFVVVMPGEDGKDVTPPVVQSLTIADQDVLTGITVTLHISATDNVSVTRMYLREWEWAASPVPHWRTVQSSGWVPFQTDYTWTLGGESGTHFVGAWVEDGARHRSRLDLHAVDFASLVLPGETVLRGGLIPYQVWYQQGVSVTATLTPTEGDADLYVWYPGSFLWPDLYSINPAGSSDDVTFNTLRDGTYLFLVHGYTAATYDLSITPPGGPRAGESSALRSGPGSGLGSAEADLEKSPVQEIVDAVFACGLDPLGSPGASEPFHLKVYLPVLVR